MTTFVDHGTLSISVEGEIVILEGTGPWNAESLQKSGRLAMPLVKPLFGNPWAVLVVLNGQAIYVPEAAENLANIVKEDKRNGRVASALLVNECDSPRFTRTHISDIYNKAGETFEFFDDVATAKAWLNAKINKAQLS